MGELKNRIKNSAAIFLILSVLVHLCTLGIINLSSDSTKLQPKVSKTVEIEIRDGSQTKLQQIVEQDERAINDETPDNARFLSRNNQRVIKETQAKNFGDFKNTAGAGTDQNAAQQEAAQKSPKKEKQLAADADGTLPSLSALNPKFNFTDQRQEAHLAAETQASAPPSATNDHLKDVDNSIETLLNSREFVYYTYYQRIRSQIRQHWEPSIREKVRRIFAEGRSIASTKDHVTRVIIVLNKQGELIGVKVVGQSGVKDLDDAAVEAFRAAQPFPNPPKGIVDNDGTIKINWDFILEA